MNQNTPNPGLALEWPRPPLIPHWMRWWSCPRMSTFDHGWYWTSRSDCRQGTEMGEAIPSRGVMLNSIGECWTKALGGTRESEIIQVQTRWNWRDHAGLMPFHFPHYVNSLLLSVTPRDSWPMRSSPLILIPCIITFDFKNSII